MTGLHLLLAAAILLPSHALAVETDFLPMNPNWNGLTEFVRLARGLQVQVRLRPTLDWAELDEHDVLLLLHPTERVDAPSFVQFVRRGGKAIVADDFGATTELLRQLAIRRHVAPATPFDTLHLNNPSLPLARATDRQHPLTRAVPFVMTNHPAYFQSELPTLLGFGDGRRQLVVAGQLGKGLFVALADPSVVINAMLQFEHNVAFATNLLRYTCRPSRDRLNIVTGYFVQRGVGKPPGTTDAGTAVVERLNRRIGRMNDFAFTEAGMRAIALVVAGLVGLALALLLPAQRRRPARTWFSLVEPDPGRTQPRHDRAEVRARRSAAASLRAVIEEQLGRALGSNEVSAAVDPAWILQRVEHLAGQNVRAECTRLLSDLARLPANTGAPITPSPGRRDAGLSAARMRDTYQRADRILRALGAPYLPPLDGSS
jgi:hypothetical protein